MTQAGLSTQARGSVMKALTHSTLLKDLIRINMSSMHPESGREKVRILLGEDPEIFFGITSNLPVIINSIMGALTELATQMQDKYPPELLKSFMASLNDDIDAEEARKCLKAWAGLASSMLAASPELRESVIRTLLKEGPRIKADAINAFSSFINGITRDDPLAFSRFFSKVVENVDGKEFGAASATISNAFLDQKWRLASWAWKLVLGRLKKRLGL